MQKRMHSREFKLEVVRQITTGQKRPAQVCRDYGLADSVVWRWLKEYRERGEAAFSPQSGEPTTHEKRIAELERFCGQLAHENQVLKKALQSVRIAERHVMIDRAHRQWPGWPIEHLYTPRQMRHRRRRERTALGSLHPDQQAKPCCSLGPTEKEVDFFSFQGKRIHPGERVNNDSTSGRG